MKRNRLFAVPYVGWMALFVVAPIVLVVLYAFTGADGGFTLTNFSRMADYHRSAECNPRNCCPDVVYELLGFLVVHTPPHHGEDLG